MIDTTYREPGTEYDPFADKPTNEELAEIMARQAELTYSTVHLTEQIKVRWEQMAGGQTWLALVIGQDEITGETCYANDMTEICEWAMGELAKAILDERVNVEVRK